MLRGRTKAETMVCSQPDLNISSTYVHLLMGMQRCWLDSFGMRAMTAVMNAVSSRETGITWAMGFCTCCGGYLDLVTDVGRLLLMVGVPFIPWAGDPGLWKWRKRTKPCTSIPFCFLIVDTL